LGYNIKTDGYFGITTEQAVVAFQTGNRLKADGIAGPSTVKVLIIAYGVKAYCLKFGGSN
jgi:peptidoglycan hydrolase-like protein with peptidoglycan-binding domain